jgi:hypothetical protein
MISEGNGRLRRDRVSISSAVAQQIKEEGRRAAESGRSQQFIDAMLVVNHRLRTDPHEFGEQTVNYRDWNLICHTGSVAPITVQFAIDEKNSTVHLRKVILRSL